MVGDDDLDDTLASGGDNASGTGSMISCPSTQLNLNLNRTIGAASPKAKATSKAKAKSRGRASSKASSCDTGSSSLGLAEDGEGGDLSICPVTDCVDERKHGSRFCHHHTRAMDNMKYDAEHNPLCGSKELKVQFVNRMKDMEVAVREVEVYTKTTSLLGSSSTKVT